MLQVFTVLILVLFGKISSSETDFKELKFIFINGNDSKSFDLIDLKNTSKLLNHPNYINSRPTMLYGYGYTEKYSSQSTQTIVNSYIERGDHNILVVEWSKYNSGNYILDAIPNAYKAGDLIGQVLLKMKTSGFNLDTFHLVGHSLGGHLVGFIGRSVYNYSNKTTMINRLTGLDPAGPLFYGIGAVFQKPLNLNDAVFVDVIHTDSVFFGAPSSIGNADFWPNGGKDQPSCPPINLDYRSEENFCSHRRSWVYYAESVRSKNVSIFDSVACSSFKKFTRNDCRHSKELKSFMGIDADPRLLGDFYLQTNEKSPFNRGPKGKLYRN